MCEEIEIIKNYRELLQIGDSFKNYKKICELLQEPELKGNSKESQQKRWKRYFDFERDKQKYIVTAIYTEPLEKNDKRLQGNNSEYLPHIELLLLDYLSKQNGYISSFTIRRLLFLLGMVNENYINESYEDLMKEREEITEFQVNHFYQRSFKKLNRILFDALNNLQNRRLLNYDKITMVNIDEMNLNGEIEAIVRPATDEERNNIKDAEREILLSMGYESMVQIHLKFKHKVFYNKLNTLLYEKYNINYSFTEIKILFTHTYIVKALELAQIEMQKKMLNNKLIESVNQQARNNYEKNQIQYNDYVDELLEHTIGEPFPSDLKKFFRLSDVYVYAQKELAEYLMRYQ